jgi:hypothetical protein
MKTLILLFLIMPIVVMAQQETQNTVLSRKWSISGWGSQIYPVSSAMRGTSAQFREEIATDYNNTVYPFKDEEGSSPNSSLFTLGFGGKLSYHIEEQTALFLGIGGQFLSKRQSKDKAFLFFYSTILGTEYTLFPKHTHLNFFGSAALSLNFIGGNVEYDYFFGNSETMIPAVFRLGVEGELGARYIIPSTPVAVELSGNYALTNLIGKSYTKPSAKPNATLPERELNDGANPDNPNDNVRTIDLFQIKLGVKIWF